jgi:excisionase family DNA binding protein
MIRGTEPAMHFGAAEEDVTAGVVEPLTVRVSRAVQLSGLSRSRIYELIQSGDLETHKVGKTTLIPYRSLKHLVTGLD